MFNFINKQEKVTHQPMIREVVGCCGKMPLHADFIKHNLKVREVVSLDDWIQDGVTLLNRRYEEKWKKVFALCPKFRFVFAGDENDKTVTGIIAPSRDKIGRSYPFVVFRATDDADIKNNQALAPIAFASTHRCFDEVLSQPWKEGTLDNLFTSIHEAASQQLDIQSTDWDELMSTMLDGTSMENLWNDILPDSDDKLRTGFMYAVMSSLQTVARRTPQRVHWGIRFPLPATDNALKHIAFWMKLSKKAIGERNWRAHVIWNPAVPGIPARLLIFFHQIPASYFTLLVEPRRTDDTVFDVLQEIETLNADPAQMSKYHFPSDMSLQEVLDEIENTSELA